MTEIHVQRVRGGEGVPEGVFSLLSESDAVLLVDAMERLEGESRTLVLIQCTEDGGFLVEAQGPKPVGPTYISSLLAQGTWVLLIRHRELH